MGKAPKWDNSLRFIDGEIGPDEPPLLPVDELGSEDDVSFDPPADTEQSKV